MVRKLQKPPNTTVENAPNKTKKVETLTNGHGDSESQNTANEITNKSGATSTESEITSIESEVACIESEVISVETAPKVEDISDLPEDIYTEDAEEETPEETKTSDSESSKTTQKLLKTKNPAVSKEVKEKKQEKAKTEDLAEDIDAEDAEEDSSEETKPSVSESSETAQNPLKNKTPADSEGIEEKEQAKVKSDLPEDIDAEDAEEGCSGETEPSVSESSKTTQKSLKRKTPAVSKEVKEKKQAKKAKSELPENIEGEDAEEIKPSVSESSKTGQKSLKRKTPAVSKDVKEKKQSKKAKSELSEDIDVEGSEEESPEETKPSVSESSKATQKQLKRKAPAISKEIKEKKQTKAKTKAKKQKVVIEVPKIKAVSGKVFVIGQNDVGQLGLSEDISDRKRPALLELPHSVVDIAAGAMHSVCLTESGEVITFGCNDEGALGRITTEEGAEFIPKKVDIPERIVQVSAGDSHSAALSDSGQVYIWGNFRNVNGPMGLVADGAKQTTPVKILNDVTVAKIASGSDHLVCLSSEGVVYTCGCGEAGQLGRVSEHASVDGGRKGRIVLLTPDKVPVLRSNRLAIVSNIWTGSYATFLNIRDSGVIYAFGLNNFNQLGVPHQLNRGFETQTTILKPKQVVSFSNRTWSQIIGGQHHTLALDDNGLVYSLGRPEYGRLGLGEDSDIKSVPTEIPSLQNDKCVDISCGNIVSFAVTDNGSAFSWGMGTNYQLGHGNENDKHTPHQIEGDFAESWKAFKIAGGGQHTLILATPKGSLQK